MREPQTEKEVIQAFRQFENVAESWEIHDTILVCAAYFGSESTVPGWFRTFHDFSQNETHSFFKSRTESMAHGAYCNQQNVDTMDFAFECYSIGVTFYAPAHYFNAGKSEADLPVHTDALINHVWQFDLPRHCSIAFKTNQDTRLEATCYAVPPGYGPTGGGAAFDCGYTAAGPRPIFDLPAINFSGTQGIPVLRNRFKLPSPIGIPRTANIEGVLTVSEYGRYLLTDIFGPLNYALQKATIDPPFMQFFQQRFGIQFSLLGKRLVQQRAQYHV